MSPPTPPAQSPVPTAGSSTGERPVEYSGEDTGHSPPRLGPRPVHQPPVDPAAAEAFRRPPGVHGAFDRIPEARSPEARAPETRSSDTPSAPSSNGLGLTPPPPEALANAFGRPPGTEDLLQRPPRQPEPADAGGDETFWSDGADRDPWRDPAAPAVLGAPAVADVSGERRAPTSGARLGIRELIFGQRLRPSAMAAFALAVLLVGATGGLVTLIAAEGGSPLTDPDVTLAEVQPGVARAAGSVSAVADRVVPAVVSIEITVGKQGGFGSGVVVDRAGYVVTNNHVVSIAAETPNARLEAIFSDGTRAPARIVGRDPKTDLAVLKVEVANPTVAQLGTSRSLRAGDTVIAIGSPLGLTGTVTTGIVSAVDRPVRLSGDGTDTNAVIDAIQTDAAINPGNSGGPLVDSTGAVVGVNTAIRTISVGEGGSIGLGFAIPIDDARVIAQELIRSGQVHHAALGVNAASVTAGTSDGARVHNVRAGSSAATAGIVENDVITRVGERPVGSADELVVAVRERRIGETVEVALVRDSRPLVVSVTLQSD